MKVEIIVPFYNGKAYIERLLSSLRKQKTSFEVSYRFLVTATGDGTEEELAKEGIPFDTVAPEEFNHALTREKAIFASGADVVIMATQDVIFEEENAIECLAKAIQGDVVAAYLRQVCRNWTIEHYTRAVNYPKKPIRKDKNSIEKMGLNTFFFSDACAAYDVAYFKEVGGYDGKLLSTNEDMYYAHKVITGGKAIQYVAESYVVHTHKFTLKQLHDRYFLFGRFFAEYPAILSYHSSGTGLKLAWGVAWRLLVTFNVPQWFMFLPNMWVRYKAKREGQTSPRP